MQVGKRDMRWGRAGTGGAAGRSFFERAPVSRRPVSRRCPARRCFSWRLPGRRKVPPRRAGNRRAVLRRRGAGGPMPGLAVLETSPQQGHDSPAIRNEMLDCLIDELQLCVGYHRSLYPDRPIEKLVFLGGGSSDHDRCRRIASALQLPADLGDPLARLVRSAHATPPVGVDLRQRQGAWACPLGLCLLPADL